LEVLNKPKVIIIGAGPAGLTAGLHIFNQSSLAMDVIILESGIQVGGLSRTHNYKGNRMDIGGHRFFSKSDKVMEWWQKIMPVDDERYRGEGSIEITYQGKKSEISTEVIGVDELREAKKRGTVMLVRNRLSRIYYLRRFFSYPISLSITTIKYLGFIRMVRIGISYIWARLFPIKRELSLEDFLINRFGEVLYKTFFKDYTEKVWGVPCQEISAEWGAQRIKGLSISKAILHALKPKGSKKDVSQKDTETSLIERFLYPRLGPGQMWELVADKIKTQGGILHLGCQVVGFDIVNQKVTRITYRDIEGKEHQIDVDFVISSMPLQDLVKGVHPLPPKEVREVAEGLVYRDFITVGLLVSQFKGGKELTDNWIYIQERDVKIGRLQIFNNWSPDLVADPGNVWLGLEYFCQEGDELWSKSEEEFLQFAINEMVQLDLISREDVLDGTVLKVPKTYPAYFGSYDRFDILVNYIKEIENLFPIGRNGMHRYNNQDHSMLTGMMAAEFILNGIKDKTDIWKVNTEMEYHEEK
jgi:protoporphyrinogen oxidase